MLFNENDTSTPNKVENIYISYMLNRWLRYLNADFTLGNCLFESLELIKNIDPDKYKYSDYGVELDPRSECLFTNGSMGRNVIIFGPDMSSSVHIDNKNKDILIPRDGPTPELDDTILTTEAKYPINFTQLGKWFILSLYYNGSNSFLFVNATKTYQLKAKKFEIKYYTLCLDNISKDFTINSMKKKQALKFFSVDFNPIDTNHVLDIHRYLMKGT